MMLTLMLTLATTIAAASAAAIVARACRSSHQTARDLAARGERVHSIARRTGLPQDVVSMLLFVVASHGANPRQKVPTAAESSRGTPGRERRLPAAPAPSSLTGRQMRPVQRGTDVAVG